MVCCCWVLTECLCPLGAAKEKCHYAGQRGVAMRLGVGQGTGHGHGVLRGFVPLGRGPQCVFGVRCGVCGLRTPSMRPARCSMMQIRGAGWSLGRPLPLSYSQIGYLRCPWIETSTHPKYPCPHGNNQPRTWTLGHVHIANHPRPLPSAILIGSPASAQCPGMWCLFKPATQHLCTMCKAPPPSQGPHGGQQQWGCGQGRARGSG